MKATWHRLADVDTDTRTATCSQCGPTAIRVRINRAHECMTVRNAQEARRRRSPQAASAKRAAELLREYGVTTDQYDRLLIEQGGGCAICGVERSHDGRALAVDHCHSTGRVRGLLCAHCNRAIGLLGDDPERLRRASQYLA
jgi:hypothetical protein